MIEILSIGSGLSIQDAGRCAWRHYGVPPSGAMDQRSRILANALLGNPKNAAVLEVVRQGARFRITEDLWLALAGADFCSAFQTGTARQFRKGDILEFDQARAGLYAYLAVAGGFIAPKWLGSAASDPRNGMGQILKRGDHLAPTQITPSISTDRVARRVTCAPQAHIQGGKQHFTLYPGPQYESFSTKEQRLFIESEWSVSMRSDRTGYRLEGVPLEVPPSIPSEPVLPGSFQVTGSGTPIVTMLDGPTVGGYAKIAVLAAEDLDRFAQCAPGTQLSFQWIHSF